MKPIIIAVLCLSSLYGIAQDVLINELMAKNNSIIQDKDGDYSDWIELYNTTNSSINLANYSLSDDINDHYKWAFPETTILPYSYMLIFASGKDEIESSELHTNFKISSSGENIYLSNNLGGIIDQTESNNLSADESFGRIPDGSIDWFVINTSTPNHSNNNSNKLTFSHQEGFYTIPFSLTINSLIADTIFYTLNGDIPTEDSYIFTNPLSIESKINQPNILSEIHTSPEQDLLSYKAWESPSKKIAKATILRCASYNSGVRTSKIYTKTFFVDDDIHDKYTFPIISLITEEKNLFSSETGIYVPGEKFKSDNPEWTGNYFMHGDEWERNIHIEYFEKNGNLGFSQDAGIRIHGGKTRQASQKSLALFARDEYGEKYFKYKLLPKRETNKYKRFLLRTTMGAWGKATIIKDILAQNISSSLNIDYQEFNPVVVFINGEYWGIHTIRDRVDERYIGYTHNIDKDSIHFKEWGNPDYENLLEFIKNNSLKTENNYEYIKSKIDIDNYISYMIAEMFFANKDWPANNIKLYKKIPDGKWKWILYDVDAGLGEVSYDMFEQLTKNDPSISWPNPPSSTFLFRNLLKNEMFKSQFIHRYAELLNSAFGVDIMVNKLDSIKTLYLPEIQNHIYRWNFPNSVDKWEADIENHLLSFIKKRPCLVRYNLMTFFELSDFEFKCDSIRDLKTDLILAPNPNKGNCYLLHNNEDLLKSTLEVIDINGRSVYKEFDVDILKKERKYLDLTFLPNNIYFLKITSDNYSEQKKFVKIRN